MEASLVQVGALQYRPDWLAARQRMAAWWNGEDIGRPAMQIYSPRAEPWEVIPEVPAPDGMVTHYTTKSLAYRVNAGRRGCLLTDYHAEAVPSVSSGDLAPNCLALYLGCRGVEMPGTVWCEPFITDRAQAEYGYDPENFYWQFSLQAFRAVAAQSRGKQLQQFPDLIEGLDTLAALRGTEELLEDLLDHPEWVQAQLRRITDLYFHYYDVLYDIIRDNMGGSVFWAWAPGRMAKFQCDFSAMISPQMFGEFMVPVLREMTERVSYCMYHWDGPGALPHHDHLLALPDLDMLQWTAGAGVEPEWHPRWWPLYHKTFAAGKKCFLWVDSKEHLQDLRREFGERCKGFLLNMRASSAAAAEELMHMMEF